MQRIGRPRASSPKGNTMKTRFVTTLFTVGLLHCGAVQAVEPSVPGVIKIQDSMVVAARPQAPTADQGKKLKKGEVCWTRGLLTEVWNCPFLGGVTISQVYNHGWRVADMSVGGNGAPAFLVIEEQ
jgi:hypothetical protein